MDKQSWPTLCRCLSSDLQTAAKNEQKDHADAAAQYENVGVDLDELIQLISIRLDQVLRAKRPDPEAAAKSSEDCWRTAPQGLDKVKEAFTDGTKPAEPSSECLNKAKECFSVGRIIARDIMPFVQNLLKDIGPAQYAITGLLVFLYVLDRLDSVFENQEECVRLLKAMNTLAQGFKSIKEGNMLLEGTKHAVREATELILAGCVMCVCQIDSTKFSKFFKASANKDELNKFMIKINHKYTETIMGIIIQTKKKAPVPSSSGKFTVGIDAWVKEVIGHLQWESPKKSIAIILHGPKGIGKSNLADVVWSQLAERPDVKYRSKVCLFNQQSSKSNDIVELQRNIIADLYGNSSWDIKTHEDGQKVLRKALKEMGSIIYIDHVLGGDELQFLLPTNLTETKKLRLLVTARDKAVGRACRIRTEDVVYYDMGKRSLRDGDAEDVFKYILYLDSDAVKEQKLSFDLTQIVQACGGNPQLLGKVADIIRVEGDQEESHRNAMEEIENWKRAETKEEAEIEERKRM